MTNSEKKKYNLFCLLNKSKTNEFVDVIKKETQDENFEFKLENFETAYPIKEFVNDYQYLNIFFSCSSLVIKHLEKEILPSFQIRYILLNEEKNKNKAKVYAIKTRNEKEKRDENIKK